ncbi:hypothetical protein [Egbenema bharatensis]|uniref:hypothetical protein n=1 Tax=Egbenema bharatensis TaxID=3463334 RepID=UPI003A84E6F3
MTDDLKLKIYPAVIGVLGAFLVASLLLNVEIQVDRGIPTDGIAPTDRPIDRASPTESDLSTPVPELPALADPEPNLSIGIDAQGGLRVSNQTDYPLRVALLPQQTNEAVPEVALEGIPAFNQPVHWDFAPQEGRARGLILSLPNEDLQLQPGDVLVAFAQDGSRRYWGPFVVGETALPAWNSATREWQLILRP